jgi:hypothetical protein
MFFFSPTSDHHHTTTATLFCLPSVAARAPRAPLTIAD